MNVVPVSGYASAVMRAGFACSVTETYRRVFERFRDGFRHANNSSKASRPRQESPGFEPGETTVSDKSGRSKLSAPLTFDC